jgi:AcrR family transcriptional regulator
METGKGHPEERCKRGRPREFDECAALDAAMAVFWRNGYEGTSLTDLTDAMGINRPSLYAAFGNKESLFRRVMDRYAERARAMLEKCLVEKTARAFVECMLRGAADSAGNRKGLNGCFLVQGAMSCARESESIRREVAARRVSSVAVLEDRFERAITTGELPKGTSAKSLAGYFAAVLQGMAVRAADGADKAAMHGVVDFAMMAWPAMSVKKRTAKKSACPACR